MLSLLLTAAMAVPHNKVDGASFSVASHEVKSPSGLTLTTDYTGHVTVLHEGVLCSKKTPINGGSVALPLTLFENNATCRTAAKYTLSFEDGSGKSTTVELNLLEGVTGEVWYGTEADVVVLRSSKPPDPPNTDGVIKAWLRNGARHWNEVELSNGRLKDSAGAAVDVVFDDAIVRVLEGGVLTDHAIKSDPNTPKTPKSPEEVFQETRGSVQDAIDDAKCGFVKGNTLLYHQWVDTTGDFPELDAQCDGILPPNTAVRVVVIHKQGETVGFSATGSRGLVSGTTYNGTGVKLAYAEPTAEPTLGYTTSQTRFGPRQPGDFDVDVVLDVQGTKRTFRREFAVEKRYAAAVRLGVGMVFAQQDREYAALRAPGSLQAEVTSTQLTPSVPAHMELVLGLAAFLDRRGRGYIHHRDVFEPNRFAPYLGLGVLTFGTENPLSTLRSAYFGVEWEASQGVSVALTGAVRRVRTLSDLYVVGGPIDDSQLSEVPMKSGYAPGAGIVLNFSPDFLAIARNGSKP